jgi:Zn-dependent membrane protease YugP
MHILRARMSATIWFLLLVPFLLGLAVQMLVKSVFRRYRAVPNHAGVTGAEAARSMLDARGLQRVGIDQIPGFLTDNYDGEAHALHLSQAVGSERSVSSLGIAGHEVSHAYQDADGDRAFRARSSIGKPLSRLAPWSAFFLIAGFWFGVPVFVVLSLLFVGGLVLFALATLPVEIGASHRALDLLRDTGLADQTELKETRQVLTAAALTYVVGLLDRLGVFLALLFIAEAARRVMS